jgi:hypothetical protein
MTLILCVRAGISSAPRTLQGLQVLVGKWDLHQNLGSLALMNETDRSSQHCRSLSHTLNPEAMRGDGHGLGVKAASVIDYFYLHRLGRTGESNTDRLGSRMSGCVGQGFLENAIQRDLDP